MSRVQADIGFGFSISTYLYGGRTVSIWQTYGAWNEYQNFVYFKKVLWFETGGSVGKTDHRFGFPDPTLLMGVEYRGKMLPSKVMSD